MRHSQHNEVVDAHHEFPYHRPEHGRAMGRGTRWRTARVGTRCGAGRTENAFRDAENRMYARAEGRRRTVAIGRAKLGTTLALVVSIAALTGGSMTAARAAAQS